MKVEDFALKKNGDASISLVFAKEIAKIKSSLDQFHLGEVERAGYTLFATTLQVNSDQDAREKHRRAVEASARALLFSGKMTFREFTAVRDAFGFDLWKLRSAPFRSKEDMRRYLSELVRM